MTRVQEIREEIDRRYAEELERLEAAAGLIERLSGFLSFVRKYQACEGFKVSEMAPAWYRNSWAATPRVSIFVAGVKDFGDPGLEYLVKGVQEICGNVKPHAHDDAGCRMRWITFHAPVGEKGDTVSVNVSLSVAYHDAVCKVIETGEVEAKKKFVCPGDPDYPEEAA